MLELKETPSMSGAVEVIHLGAYVRISDDDKDENGNLTREGVRRQESDCRGLADAIGGTVVKVYDDNNITAADERVTRPGFEQLLKDLESGVIQGFVFYHADRVCRLELDAARLTRLFRLNPKLIGRSVTGGTDLSTDEGRAMFVMQAVMGGMEVSAIRRRVKRRNRDAAAAGKVHGGKRPFGWEADRKTLRQWEADLMAKAIRDVPKGKTVGMIRKEWIAAGVTPTANGKGVLRDHTVLVRITNPRVCGYRVYMSADDRRETKTLWLPDTLLLVDGEPVIGDWTPIVTPQEWKACVATLESRMKGYANDFTRLHAKYLLSGIARCGECGTRMYARVDPGTERYAYRCLAREGGCGKIRRHGPAVDEYVEDLFLEATRRALGEVEHDDIDDTIYDDRITQLRQEIKEVMARRKPGHPKPITTAVAMDLVSELEAEIADLTYKARTLTAAKVRRQSDAPSLLREWESYTIDMKRDRIRRDISAVVINRSGKGFRFNPALIEIVWAD
jgi:DNA invertase Pin-like site-specific DNA recombinase